MDAIYYMYVIAIAVLSTVVARVFYLVFIKNNGELRRKAALGPVKTMIILGSGGHTAEMLKVVEVLDFKNYSPRVYVYACTDSISGEKVKSLERNNADYRILKIYRSREVLQSYLTSVWSTILATCDCIPLLWRESPKLILCNGPGTCVPMCIIAFLFKLFYIREITVIFIESFCRVKTFSLSGKILYYLVDYVIVQWAYLSKPMYKRSILI